MENIKRSFYERIVIRLLEKFTKGNLALELPSGEKLQIGESEGYEVDIRIKNPNFFKKCVLYGDVGFGEAFCDGDWETSDLTKVIRWVIDNVENSAVMSGAKNKAIAVNFLEIFNKVTHLFNKNTKGGSKENISFHYDISNDFYELMLDPTMSYSCGIFNTESTTLEEAQLEKLKRLCEDLDIKKGDHILEIGCGWGGFAEYATTHYDCKITGITISKEQYEFALNRMKKIGVEDRVTLLLEDYRELEGKFDKIVSVEMIEAVGHEFLPEYFESIDRLLKKDGVAVIQAITSPDSRYDSFRKGVDFIQKHIFPGSLLPSVGAMVSACQKNTELQLINLRDIGYHYGKTLRLWMEAVNNKWNEIEKLGMDNAFYLKWKYYLCYCEAAFLERNISDVQVTFIKPNNTSYKIKSEPLS